MEMKISNKVAQPLLSRTELVGTISFDAATPSRSDVRKKLAESLKSDESLIMVRDIATAFGSKSANITAHVYKSKEDLAKFESKTVLQRHLPKKEEDNKEAAEKKTAPADTAAKKTDTKKATKPDKETAAKKEGAK